MDLMNQSRFGLLPESVSTISPKVDALFWALSAISVFFTVLIFTLLVGLAWRYRRRSDAEVPRPIHGSVPLEIAWSVIPLVISLAVFVGGAVIFFEMKRPPSDTLDVYVVGKQWMWKIQHPEGKREINELHVPRGQNVRLVMSSEDVIHSFFVPAFRIKQDVLPGRYTQTWFNATETGEYHLFCTEYCGTDHAAMIGRVIVMEPEDYQRWLSGVSADETPVQAGERLFAKNACNTCHGGAGGVGPMLAGRWGGQAQLEGGESVKFDENYVRESIVKPMERIAAGYQPVMPTYQGQISEEEIQQIIAYIRSQGAPAPTSSSGVEHDHASH